MKISISKIIIFCFVIFSLSVFWRGLKINKNYDTKNLIGSRISNFKLSEINNNEQYISEKNLKKFPEMPHLHQRQEAMDSISDIAVCLYYVRCVQWPREYQATVAILRA